MLFQEEVHIFMENDAIGKYGSKMMAEILLAPGFNEYTEALREFYKHARESNESSRRLFNSQLALAIAIQNWQEMKTEFKQEGNLKARSTIDALIWLAKRVQNVNVWRTLNFNRAMVSVLSQHNQTGHIDESITQDFAFAEMIMEESKFHPLINDLSTILRYGDVTVVDKVTGQIYIRENKGGRGSRKSSRSKKQKKNLTSVQDFLKTEKRRNKKTAFLEKIRTNSTEFNTHHEKLRKAIKKSREKGIDEGYFDDCIQYRLLSFENMPEREAPHLKLPHQFHYPHHSEWYFGMVTPRLIPYGNFPLAPDDCFDLMARKILLQVNVDMLNFAKLLSEYEIELHIPDPDKGNELLKLDLIQRRKAISHNPSLNFVFALKRGKQIDKLSPALFSMMAHELISSKTVAKICHEIMLDSANFGRDEIEQHYYRFESDSKVWS